MKKHKQNKSEVIESIEEDIETTDIESEVVDISKDTVLDEINDQPLEEVGQSNFSHVLDDEGASQDAINHLDDIDVVCISDSEAEDESNQELMDDAIKSLTSEMDVETQIFETEDEDFTVTDDTHLNVKLKAEGSNNHSKKKYGIIFLIVMAILAMILYSNFNRNLEATQLEDKYYQLEVASGESFNEVLDRLVEDRLIKNRFASKIYARLSQNENISAGMYHLNYAWDAKTLIQYLNDTMPTRDVQIHFKDGAWAKDIAKEIGVQIELDEQDIINTWNDVDYIKTLMDDYDFLTEEIFEYQDDKRVLLEGYLYPDTYLMDFDSSIDQVTRVLLNNFEDKFESIKKDVEKSEFSIQELVTLSSIVMYEAGSDYDQQMVAGTFMNRIESKMPLQSSVTVCYVLYEFDDWTDCELYKNQEIDSPYNTYLYAGLPIGPILNPSIKAIKNTVNYIEHDYFFFVADVYEGGDGTVYYTKTFGEHQKKVNQLRNR